MPVDPWRAYARSDAALVGVFLGKRDATTYAFRVEQDYKVDLGRELDVWAPEHGASCGLELAIGRRTGLFLHRGTNRWESSLCSQATPEQVRAAASGRKPDGTGPIRFLVGGKFGPARIQALDAAGRTLAYGFGDGVVQELAVCPGSRRSVELTDFRVGVRDLSTFRLLREVRLRQHGPDEHPDAAHCVGRDAFVAFVGEDRTRVLRVRGRTVTTIRRTRTTAVAFGGSRAYLSTPRRIFSLDLRSGRIRTLAHFSAEQLVVTPDGALLGALTFDRLIVIRLRGRRAIFRGPFVSRRDDRWLVWDRRQLTMLGPDDAEVYNERLRLLGRFPSSLGGGAIVLGGRIMAVVGTALRVARLPSGPVRIFRRFGNPGPGPYAVAAVDRGPDIRLAGRLPCARG